MWRSRSSLKVLSRNGGKGRAGGGFGAGLRRLDAAHVKGTKALAPSKAAAKSTAKASVKPQVKKKPKVKR